MKIKFSAKKIELEKDLNALDNFVLDFTDALKRTDIKYVLVSGYVSIVFGRNRSSEDVDIIIEKMTFEKFEKFWNSISKDFECITTENSRIAYEDYLITRHAIRFSKKDRFIPNIEMTFPKTELEAWVLDKRKDLVLNNKKIFISPIELQIPFKLFLGSEKDIEDAKFLYVLFKDKLELSLLKEFNKKLNVEKIFDKYMR